MNSLKIPKIKKITQFVCPQTGKKFKTEEEALKSAALAIKNKEETEKFKAQQKEYWLKTLEKKDWLRLNLENVCDLPKLITEKAKEFWDIDIEDFNLRPYFGNVSNTHNCPINGVTNWYKKDDLPKGYLGWSGYLRAKVKSKVVFNDRLSACDILFGINHDTGFRGFHTTSGCPGTINKLNIEIGFLFFLDDFPKLKTKYKIFLKEKTKIEEYDEFLGDLDEKSFAFAKSQQDIIEIKKQLDDLEKKLDKKIISYKQDFYSKNLIPKPTIVENYEGLSKNFL